MSRRTDSSFWKEQASATFGWNCSRTAASSSGALRRSASPLSTRVSTVALTAADSISVSYVVNKLRLYSATVDWKLSVAGLLIGLLVGMTGMGGGSLMTPMLVLLFGFKPSVAIGTDILHGAIFKSFGAARHRTLGHVHARLTFWLGSAPASLAGSPSPSG